MPDVVIRRNNFWLLGNVVEAHVWPIWQGLTRFYLPEFPISEAFAKEKMLLDSGGLAIS